MYILHYIREFNGDYLRSRLSNVCLSGVTFERPCAALE